MRRGELYLVRRPGADPKAQRVFVIVSRQKLVDSKLPDLVCAPVYSRGEGLLTQVAVGLEEGLKHESWITCDRLLSIPRTALSHYVGSLGNAKLAELNRALRIALDLA